MAHSNLRTMDQHSPYVKRSITSGKYAFTLAVTIVLTMCANLKSFQWLLDKPIAAPVQRDLKFENEDQQANFGYDMRPYSWIADHWVPPEGVPTYSALQMIDVFSRHDVLFLGDSTMRRTYLMLYEIMNHTATEKKHENKTVYATPKSNLQSGRVIDISKPGNPFAGCSSDHRDSSPDTNTRGKYLEKSGEPFFCRTVPDYEEDKATKSTKKIDYTRANCAIDAHKFADIELENKISSSNVSLMSREYDIIVLGLGVWEGLRTRDCHPSRNVTLDALQALSNLSESNGGQAIIWRTSGFDESGRGGENIREHNDATRDFFNGNAQVTRGISYIDFALNIEPRSYNADRINGDIKPHYGIEARYLHINMITHRILELENRRRIRNG